MAELEVSLSGRRWLELDPPLSTQCISGITRLGFKFMTPVQSSTIPYFMQNKDVAVEAVTGSGKTLAFAIPVVEILLKRTKDWSRMETGALIVTPTRELATQIAGVLRVLLPPSLSLAVLIGGRDPQRDTHLLKTQGAQLVVGTPGRLADLLARPDCPLAAAMKALEVLVLDEADRLLELGFMPSISTILSYLPKQRQTGLFSATLNAEVKALIRAGLRNPLTLTVRDRHATDVDPLAPTPNSLSPHYLVCTPQLKFAQLVNLLQQFRDRKIIVFFATCASVSYFAALTKRLVERVKVFILHGKMHSRRHRVFTDFADTDVGVLMSTDVMARGVDFPGVHWVIQFDPPSSTKAFVHRCGRTARMGQAGKAVVMLLPSEAAYVEFLELNQHITLQPFPTESPPDPAITSRAREMAAKERELYDYGVKAFVSFVHFYYKHECKLIFQSKKLDLVALAQGFALPHLPRMPELRVIDTSAFVPHTTPANAIPFKNKARQKARLARLEKEELSGKPRRKLKTVWKTRELNDKKLYRRGRKRKRKTHTQELSDRELEELSREARLLKKFKAGKISKTELEIKLDSDIT